MNTSWTAHNERIFTLLLITSRMPRGIKKKELDSTMARVYVRVDNGSTRGLYQDNVYINGRLSEFRTAAEARYWESCPPPSPHWFGGQDENASSERFRTGAGYDIENELFYAHRERETELVIREAWCAWGYN